MHCLGLEVQGKSEFKAKMANNVSVKCVGVCRGIKITVCGIKVAASMYVIQIAPRLPHIFDEGEYKKSCLNTRGGHS